jgi:hypothetical protein
MRLINFAIALPLLLMACGEGGLERKAAECRFDAQKQFGVLETQYDLDILKGGFGMNPWRNKFGEMTRLCMLAAGYKEEPGCSLAGWMMTSCYREKSIRERLGLGG